MFKKMLILTLILTLCVGTLGVAGCARNAETAAQTDAADEEVLKEDDREADDNEGDDDEEHSNIPELFAELGFIVLDGDINDDDLVDEEKHAEVTVTNDMDIEDVAADAERQLEKIGAKDIDRTVTEENKVIVITATIMRDDGSQFDFYLLIELQDDGKTSIFNMTQDHEERMRDMGVTE